MIPGGWVITHYEQNTLTCPDYVFTLEIPGSTTVACTSSTVPAGYVIVLYDRTLPCIRGTLAGPNAFTLKVPGNYEVVCASSPVPNGYVVTDYGQSPDCLNYSATGTNTKTIQRSAPDGDGGGSGGGGLGDGILPT